MGESRSVYNHGDTLRDLNSNREPWQESLKERISDFVDAFYERLVWLWKHGETLSEWIKTRPVLTRALLVWGSLMVSTFFATIFRPLIRPDSQFLLYLPAVAFSGLFAGVGWGTAASIIGALISMYAFVLPARTEFSNPGQDTVALLLYFMASALILFLNRVQELQKQEIRNFAATLETKVSERTAELQKANEELQSFCYSISHDLRAPMRNIVGSSRMIIEDLDEKLDKEAKENLLSIGASANRLAQLVDDLLNHARIGHAAMNLQKVSLSELAEEVATEIMQGNWGFPIEVTVEPNMTTVCDPEMMRLALHNLLENACKYAARARGVVIEVGETRRRGWPVYYIRDNGIGFDMQYVDKIFEPFQRLHRDVDYPGTGIGLANVKRIVERHRGTIWAEGQPGLGACFYFTLGRLTSERSRV